MLLAELTRKYPLPIPKPIQAAVEPRKFIKIIVFQTYEFIFILRNHGSCYLLFTAAQVKQEPQTDKKDMKPPPERKPRLN